MAKAHLRCCEVMNVFFYGFGVAIALAMALAIGNTWVRDHRNGVWTIPMALGLVVVAIVVGITIGWSLVEYFAFYNAAAAGRT
jgi:predicted PurR-regulated permease PerM